MRDTGRLVRVVVTVDWCPSESASSLLEGCRVHRMSHLMYEHQPGHTLCALYTHPL
jgi:hypothetical protein